MTSETDEQFVERMALTTFWNDASGGMTVGDFTRLFALARRGAEAAARIKELEGDLQIAKLQLAAKRFT